MTGVSQISEARAKPKKSSKERTRTTKYKSMSPSKWLKFRKFYETSEFSLLVCCRIHEVNYRSAQSRSKAEGWVKKVEEKKIPAITGTPTTYKPEYAKRIIEYFSNQEPWREVEISGGRIQLVPNKINNLAGFAASVGVHRTTLFTWANERDSNGDYVNPDFHYAYLHAMSLSEDILLKGGLGNVLNSNVAALALRNHHFYQTEKQEPIETSHDKTLDAELDEIYERALENSRIAQEKIRGRFTRITGLPDPSEYGPNFRRNTIEAAEFEEVNRYEKEVYEDGSDVDYPKDTSGMFDDV